MEQTGVGVVDSFMWMIKNESRRELATYVLLVLLRLARYSAVPDADLKTITALLEETLLKETAV